MNNNRNVWTATLGRLIAANRYTVYMIMNDIDYNNFRNQVLKQIVRNKKFIKSTNSIFHECAWDNLYIASQTLFKCIKTVDNKATEKENILLQKLTNCLSDILNALLSTTGGFLRGPGVLLRSIIESIACTIVIKMDNNKYDQYINNKLSPSSQITPSKKYFPEIGQIYGMLTNTFVHERYETISRCIVELEDNIEFSLLPNIEDIDFYQVYLLLISMLSRFVGAFSEYCFQHKFHQLYYWTRTDRKTVKENKKTKEALKILRLLDEMPDKYKPEQYRTAN